jgi:primase-polymerase (primpol)-like protein
VIISSLVAGVKPGSVVPSAIPAALRDLPQWVAWRPELRPGKSKPAKVPINPHTGRTAKVTDSRTWGTFDRAAALAHEQQLAGIGYVFAAEDPYCGIDLDRCIDPASGRLDPWAEEIVADLMTYTEVSPSGSGVKLVLRGRLPEGRRRRGKVELYDRGRYFALTGVRLPGTPADVLSRQPALDALHRELFGDGRQPAPPAVRPAAALSVADAELVRRALRARNGAKFRQLWNGHWSGYSSPSEASYALASLLLYWTGGDVGRAEALFRQSGLMRPKCDERRGGTTWLRYSLERVAPSVTRVYTPPVVWFVKDRPPRVGAAMSFDEFRRYSAESALAPQVRCVFDRPPSVLPLVGQRVGVTGVATYTPSPGWPVPSSPEDLEHCSGPVLRDADD